MTAEKPDDATKQAFESVAATLLERGRVEIHGFGIFELHRRRPRSARNPRTGERIDVPATTVVRFRPAKALKDRAAAVANVPRS